MRKVLLVIPFAALLAGCGGSGGGGAGEQNQGHLGEKAGVSGDKITLILKDFNITPGTLDLPKTGKYTITYFNEGAQTHNVEVEGQGIEEKGKDITFGENSSFTVDFSKPGKYEMYCPVDGHKDLGMEGTINVASGA